MIKPLIILIISILMFALSLLIKSAKRKDDLNKSKIPRTTAVIDRTIISDGGNAMYYVSFTIDNTYIIAQTDYYSSKTKSLNPGDTVEIGYYFTEKNVPRAVIYDQRVIPCSESILSLCRLFNIIGLLLLAVDLFIVISSLLNGTIPNFV